MTDELADLLREAPGTLTPTQRLLVALAAAVSVLAREVERRDMIDGLERETIRWAKAEGIPQ